MQSYGIMVMVGLDQMSCFEVLTIVVVVLGRLAVVVRVGGHGGLVVTV